MKNAFALFALFLMGAVFAQAAVNDLELISEGTAVPASPEGQESEPFLPLYPLAEETVIVNVGEETPQETQPEEAVETETSEEVETEEETTAPTQGGPSSGLRANVIQMQYDKASCRLEFYKKIMAHAGERGREAGSIVDTEAVISSLDANQEALQEASASTNREAFNNAAHAVREDVKEVARKYLQIKRELEEPVPTVINVPPPPVRENAKQRLRTAFIEEKQVLAACLQDSSHQLAEAQRDYLLQWKEKAQEITERLHAKGLDTGELEDVLSETDVIIADAQIATNTADESVVDKVEVVKHHHHHLWAKFQLARISILLNAIEPRAEKAGFHADVEALRELVATTQARLHAEPYTVEEFGAIQEGVKQAIHDLGELLRKTKEA
ncbi:MAG TPA: hypothetical protein VJH24_05725 [Candidatus Bilamarchaeaceae archaeon]|nr:hypothetical protein [Candidatus Bilamarchaeaceae archaeon]